MLSEIVDTMYNDNVHPMCIWEFIYLNTELVDVNAIVSVFCKTKQHYYDFCLFLRDKYNSRSNISDFDDWGINGEFEHHESDLLYHSIMNALLYFDDTKMLTESPTKLKSEEIF